MGTLYVVSTPIGNLEDISLRALRVLREVKLIAAEDTRHTRKLLNRVNIPTPTRSYHQHSAPSRISEIIASLTEGDVALVTDAGTPGLSDPGGELVEAAAHAGFPVVPVPGASALLALVASSGLEASRFSYLGFLPRKGKERAAILDKAAQTGWPFVIYESPRRLAATLADILQVVGDTEVVVGRELTKLHEEIFRGKLSGAVERFSSQPVRGEVAIMVAAPGKGEPGMQATADLDAVLEELEAQGLPAKEIARQAASLAGVSTREAYNRLVRSRNTRGLAPMDQQEGEKE
jgi:16S rRNA (cytidine1402-2'-O)-methyltransferase